MKTMLKTFRPTAMSVALMLVFGPALAEEPNVDELAKPDSSISVGIGNWSADRPHEGVYDGMRDKGAYGLLDADIIKRDDTTGTWLKLKATNLGLDAREIKGEYLRQGDIGGSVEYNKTPRDNPYTVNTGLQGIGTTNVTVGTNLGSFAKRDVDLGTTRELLRLGGYKNLLPGLDFKIDFKNEDKKGTRLAGWGSAALFSVEPIDSTTRQLEAMLQYTGKQLQLSGGYYGSWYDNHNSLLLQQLNGVTGGTSASFSATTPMSLPLSNQAHQIFLDGGYAFTPTTRGTFKVAYSMATQDEHLPSYDLTGANAPFVGTPSHLDGRVDTTLVQLGLSSRPMPKLLITANLRYYDLNDKTPLAGFVGNNTTGVASVYNTPQSYTTTSGKLEATYRLPENFSLTGGVDYSGQDRSQPSVGTVYVPFRTEVNETTYRLQVRRSLADSLNGTLGYLHSDRNGSSYLAANGSSPYSNQINPVHIADRSRDKWRAAFDWEPLDKLSLQLRIDHSQDTYPEDGRPYGMRDGSAQLYAVDGSYAFSDNWLLSAWYSLERTKARAVGFRQAKDGSADAVKDSHLKDVGDSFGLNLRGKLTARLDAGIGLDWFRSTSSTAQDLTLSGAGATYPTAAPGTSGPLPDIKNNLLRLKLDAKYAIDKSSDLRFDLIHERWHTDDWSWNYGGGSPFAYYTGTQTCTGCVGAGYTGVVDGTTVTSNKTQSASFIGIRYIYRFQ
ncbi:MtrB/PioB family decaheme-associated outer membrane protein [Propionivibrio sp.]|uniref:MtrB/PioB family decaheme-associated outer membrane protein n=1 Tax=Propionivibrio sp. TaxID=2212460 RepID=UPI002621B815|nr:MtrB/PioB family decaheme-associated outer membrane protein [Propionivibrio sp.]